MSFSQPRWLTLDEAVEWVTGWDVPWDMARHFLECAWRERELVLVDGHGKRVTIPRDIQFEWHLGKIVSPPDRIGGVGLNLKALRTNAEDIDKWLGKGPRVVTGTLPRRARGRKPTKYENVIRQMMVDIESGRQSRTALGAELEKNLAHRYGASRGTIRKARNSVLSELGAN